MKEQEKANKENTHSNSTQASETPFFARFLEGQHAETESEAANDKAIFTTLKYPSDRDEIDRPLSHI